MKQVAAHDKPGMNIESKDSPIAKIDINKCTVYMLCISYHKGSIYNVTAIWGHLPSQ